MPEARTPAAMAEMIVKRVLEGDVYALTDVARMIEQDRRQAQADERERCARFVEHYNDKNPDDPDRPPAEIAAAIRSLPEETHDA